MLKLFKYNWKMNSIGFYITFTALVLLYALLLFGKHRYGWIDEIILAFGVVLSALSGLIVHLMAGVTFNHGLKSYHRRLIPIKPLEELASIVMLAAVYNTAATVLAFCYFIIADVQLPYEIANDVINELLEFKSILIMVGLMIWHTISFMTLLMLAISSSYCFRGKHRAWIGVIVFIAIPVLGEYIKAWLVGDTADNYFSFINFELNNGGELSGGFELTAMIDFWSLPALLDIIAVALQVVAASYLLKKRIQL